MIDGGSLDEDLYDIKHTDDLLVANVTFQNVGT